MFKYIVMDDGRVPHHEYLPAGAITPKWGMALTQTSGNLAVCSGTTKPDYISMEDAAAAHTAGDIIPVIRVDADMIFETEFSANAGDGVTIALGQKVTLESDGLRVTANKNSGVAEVVRMSSGNAVQGETVWVRFP